MRALITGANGQLGRALAASVPHDWSCYTAGRGELDIRDGDAVQALLERARPDIVINAAAYTAVDDAEANAEAAYAINAHGVATLAHWARVAGSRFVHLSTDYVFDGESPRAYRPTDERNPLSVYGSSKAAGEVEAGPDALIIRTAWVYAAVGRNFLTTMLRVMRERDEVRVVCDQIGSPTYAPRLAEIIWALTGSRASGVYHYSDAGVASWYDFAVAIAEEAEAFDMFKRRPRVLPIRTSDYPTAARRPAISLLDSSATLAKIGGTPSHWRENLRLALAELRGLEPLVSLARR